jgi:YfiH family protein
MISPGDLESVHRSSPAALPIETAIYKVRALDRFPELLHGISTRLAPDAQDWNLSGRRGTPQHPPSIERAFANREKLARHLGISLDRMVGCQQVHGTEVAVVSEKDGGRGMYPHLPSMQGADAMVTDTPGLYLLALSADCPPVFFYDPEKRAIGLAHSGWKGTAGRISANVVGAMRSNFGSDPADIIAAVGPGIGPCCYNVYPSVVETVEASFPHAWDSGSPVLESRDGIAYFNLWEGIRRALLDAGVRRENISVESVCTAHNVGMFYSHRGEAGQCGLFGAVLGLREGT